MKKSVRTEILKINPRRPDVEKLDLVAKMLKRAKLVAFPTETVYGIGAVYNDKDALKRLISVKRRPWHKPFTVHIADFLHFDRLLCKKDRLTKEIAHRFWPGPLTLIVRTKNGQRLGFRMPDEKIARYIIRRAGGYVFLPSANISGERPPRAAKDVVKHLSGYIDVIVDAGPCRLGVESTVLDLTEFPPKILREGAIGKKVRRFLNNKRWNLTYLK